MLVAQGKLAIKPYQDTQDALDALYYPLQLTQELVMRACSLVKGVFIVSATLLFGAAFNTTLIQGVVYQLANVIGTAIAALEASVSIVTRLFATILNIPFGSHKNIEALNLHDEVSLNIMDT